MKKINFFVPLSIVKGGEGESSGLMQLEGVASTSDEDTDRESLNPSGYNLKPFLDYGFVNWNHKAKDNPGAIIGEPEVAYITEDNKLYVKISLYPDSEKAREVWDLANTIEKNSSKRKLGFSIEGFPKTKDPLNPKKILTADITGLAITPQPKNKNSFAQIVKGEYQKSFEPIEEEEEEEQKVEKMDTSSMEPVTKESIDLGDRTELKKSEIYSLIKGSHQSLPSTEVNLIYNFLEKNNIMEKVSIQKALDDLGKFLKGESSEETIGKSEESEILKAAKECYKSDMSENQLSEELIRKGFSLDESISTAKSIVADANENKQGGSTQKLPQDAPSSISKGEDAKEFHVKSDSPLLVKGEDGSQIDVVKHLERTSDSLGKMFLLMQDMFEKSESSNLEFKEDLEIIKSENEELSKKVEELESQPGQRKSVKDVTFKERFDKSEQPEEIEKGVTSYDLSSKVGRNSLCDFIIERKEEAIQKGEEFDEEIVKAISSIELTGKIPTERVAKKIDKLIVSSRN